MDEQSFIARREAQDVMHLFPLYKGLLDHAAKAGFDASDFMNYSGETSSANYQPTPLPKKFQDLVQDHPASYYIVAYDDRRGAGYQEGTKHRMVRLSTVPVRSESNQLIREVDIKDVDPSMGNLIEMSVRESVNNQSFAEINEADDDEIEASHGEARCVYQIKPDGQKTVTQLKYNRLDEGLFQFGGSAKAVRWVRNLNIEGVDSDEQRLTYQDLYIIGRSRDVKKEGRAEIRSEINGSGSEFKSITIQMGIPDPSESERVIVDDQERGVKIIIHDNLPGYENQEDVLRDDPVYSILFEEPIDIDRFSQLLKGRIDMLQDQWDQPQSVYDRAELPEGNKKITK